MEVKVILEGIKNRWKSVELNELIAMLDLIPVGSATGGEAMARTGKFLSDLKNSRPIAYLEAKDLIEQYLLLCIKYKIQIRE